MLPQAIAQINEHLLDLCWTDKVAGLTVLARKVFEDKEGKVTKVFPVSCDVSIDDCWRNGKYKELTPDNKLKSVVYWDQTGSTGQAKDGKHNAKLLKFETTLKLVMWFDLKALGKDNCGFCNEVYTDLILLACGDIKGNENVGGINILDLQMDSQEDVRTYFNRYSYGDKDKLFFYPYEACTFTMKLQWMTRKDCLVPASCGVKIDC